MTDVEDDAQVAPQQVLDPGERLAAGGRKCPAPLEPEPACWLETTEETVRFFEERIYSLEGRRAFAAASGAVWIVGRTPGSATSASTSATWVV